MTPEKTMNSGMPRARLGSFSDAVFAVIITIMVLQLKLPAHATFASLLDEWPTALSYAVSYVLIAIMWINHHFLLGFAKGLTPRLILWSFTHMFSASLVPFATAWGSRTTAVCTGSGLYLRVSDRVGKSLISRVRLRSRATSTRGGYAEAP